MNHSIPRHLFAFFLSNTCEVCEDMRNLLPLSARSDPLAAIKTAAQHICADVRSTHSWSENHTKHIHDIVQQLPPRPNNSMDRATAIIFLTDYCSIAVATFCHLVMCYMTAAYYLQEPSRSSALDAIFDTMVDVHESIEEKIIEFATKRNDTSHAFSHTYHELITFAETLPHKMDDVADAALEAYYALVHRPLFVATMGGIVMGTGANYYDSIIRQFTSMDEVAHTQYHILETLEVFGEKNDTNMVRISVPAKIFRAYGWEDALQVCDVKNVRIFQYDDDTTRFMLEFTVQ